MHRLLSGTALFLWLSYALAQSGTAPEPPPESHPIALIVFGVLFVGFCVGIVWLIWRGGKSESTGEKKEDDPGAKHPAA